MKQNLQTIAKDLLPPLILRSISSKNSPYSGSYSSWHDAVGECSGYDDIAILDKILDATLKVQQGEAAFERDSILFEKHEYIWSVLSVLMWVAARFKGRLNVLDFGGSLGSSYFQYRPFLQSLPDVQWNIVEQPHFVKAGEKYINDSRLSFYSTIEDCLAENAINVILLSSVLQYLPDPYAILEQLTQCNASCLIIDRTPIINHKEDHLVIQTVPENIYKAKYPSWLFSSNKINNKLKENWNLISSTLSMEGHHLTKDGIEFSFKGILLEAKQ